MKALQYLRVFSSDVDVTDTVVCCTATEIWPRGTGRCLAMPRFLHTTACVALLLLRMRAPSMGVLAVVVRYAWNARRILLVLGGSLQ